MKEEYLRFEGEFLSEFAQKTIESRGRLREEKECPMRTEYQRDFRPVDGPELLHARRLHHRGRRAVYGERG